MTWHPTEKEMEAVLRLPGPQRYQHFVSKIVDAEEVWSLWKDEGWALSTISDGRETVPIWPHASYAQVCARDAWQGYLPKAISLDAWINRWGPGIEGDGRLVAVFPTPDDKGIVVDAKRLNEDLKSELEKYE